MSTARRDRWLALNFAATVFVSAFLLFQVQPLVSKCILPWFGGSPAVWTTCMLFFQTLLFGGYAYAHLSQRLLRPKAQALVHLVLIVAALLLLRVVPSESWKPTDSSNPVARILLLLAATIGLPYFVLSSTGPLMQAWFARAFPGRIPYRLYALSNVGSLLALLTYPFLVERVWDVPQQAGIWWWGFVVYAALCAYAAVSVWMLLRHERISTGGNGAHAADRAASAPWWHLALWVLLPAFASLTLLATTNHVCTDVAPVPFLWVVPLSLYLLTFIIAFDHSRWYRPAWFSALTLIAIYCVAVAYAKGASGIEPFNCGTIGKAWRAICSEWAYWHSGELDAQSHMIVLDFSQIIALNFVAMFGICMLCHGELVRLRPHPKQLTGYFLLIAAGGAMGGAAVTLMAPQLFSTFLEFKLALVAGYLLAIGLLIRSIYRIADNHKSATGWRRLLWIAPVVGLQLLLLAGVGLFDLPQYFDDHSTRPRLAVRNFFGTLSVFDHDADDPINHVHQLKHGNITHGMQYVDSELRYKPTTYYSKASGAGRAINYFQRVKGETSGMRVGAVGLGTGTLAAYLGKGDSIRFYEINPAVIEIAESGRWFTYLNDCKQRGAICEIVVGDARLTLDRELKAKQPQHFQVLVLDAFNGDAIPLHLLTEEAFRSYLEHLATPEADGEGGALAIHISNKYLDLEPVVRGAAQKLNLREVQIENSEDWDRGVLASKWIVLTQNKKLADALESYAAKPGENPRPAVLWTDERSNLFDVLR